MNNCLKQTKTFNRKRTSINKIFSLRKIIKTSYPGQVDNYVIRYASDNGHLEIVKYLSTLPGVDPSADDNEAIRYASWNGHLEVVKYLITLPGVDPYCAIRWAYNNGQSEVVRFLINLPAHDYTCLKE